MQYFFVESVSKGKSKQKSAATEVDTDDGQKSDTDMGEDDSMEDGNWGKETKDDEDDEDDEEGAELAQKKTKG